MPSRMIYPHSPGARPSQMSSVSLAPNYMPKLVKTMATPSTGGAPDQAGFPGPPGAQTTTVHTPGRWDMPDYQSLIAADPNLAAANVSIRAAGENAAAARAAQAQQAVIRAGFSPGSFGNRFGDIDAATLAAAA